jgi:hypothetical protein
MSPKQNTVDDGILFKCSAMVDGSSLGGTYMAVKHVSVSLTMIQKILIFVSIIFGLISSLQKRRYRPFVYFLFGKFFPEAWLYYIENEGVLCIGHDSHTMFPIL